MKKLITTFVAGRFCGVAHTTVIRWIKSGKLKAYVTPGGHRRIKEADMVAFMKRWKMPIPKSLPGGNPSVLVVDDEPAVITMLKKAFSKLAPDMELRSTGNGVEALVMVGEKVPDVIILDVMMPDMDGIQVCKILKSKKATSWSKIIVITGKNITEEQEDFLKKNVDLVLRKPFQPTSLIETVRTLLDDKMPVRR